MTDTNANHTTSVAWSTVERLADALDELHARVVAAQADYERLYDSLWDIEERILASGTTTDKLKIVARRHAIGLDVRSEAASVLAELAAA